MDALGRLFSGNQSAVTNRMLALRQPGGDDDKRAIKAIEVLIKKLKKKKGVIEVLENALREQSPTSKCVPFPRSADGRVQVQHRKEFPHVIYCRMWRWADVHKPNELKSLRHCMYPANTRDANQKEVCINPYHYERTQHPLIAFAMVRQSQSDNEQVDNNTQTSQQLVEHLRAPINVICTMDKIVLASDPNGASVPNDLLPAYTCNTTEIIIEWLKQFKISAKTSEIPVEFPMHKTVSSSQGSSVVSLSPELLTPPMSDSSSSNQSISNSPDHQVIPHYPDCIYQYAQGNGQYQQPEPSHQQVNMTSVNYEQCSNYQDPFMSCPNQPVQYQNPNVNYQQQNVYYQQGNVNNQQYNENYQQPNVYCQQQNVNYQQQNVNCQQQNVNYQQQNVNCQQQNVNYQQQSVNCQQQNVNYQQQSVNCQQQNVNYQQQNVNYQQQNENYQQQDVNYQQPNVNYQQQNNDPHANDVVTVDFVEPEYWANISYYELNTRVGEMFKCKPDSILVDGFTNPISNDVNRFSIGQLSNISRNTAIENARRHIGHGVRLDYCNGEVWATCLSETGAIFIQSKIANMVNGFPANTVCKLTTGVCTKIFSSFKFADLLGEAVQKGYNATFEFIKACTIRMSFVKGWGTSYNHHDVTMTPCWIEIHLNGPLLWLDRVLSEMKGPTDRISSVS